MIKTRTLAIVLIISLSSVLSMGQSIKNSAPNTKNTTVFDYSALPWVEAFDSLHACMLLRYPYTEWKAVDWPEKLATTRPAIINAQSNSDTIAFIQHLFEYLYQIPDGHIELLGEIDSFKQSKIFGSYGFNMLPLDDESIVVSFVPGESPAYAAGLRSGDRILKWNSKQIDLVGNNEYLNYFRNYATVEGRMFSRYLMLGRDSIGAVAEITFQSSQTKAESTITLTAFDDSMEMYLIGMYNTAQPINIDSLVYYDLLENNVGYLYIAAEMMEGITPEEILQSPDFIKVQDAITYFNNNGIDKLIVDLRFNIGGNDMQAAVTMGLFYDNSSFYEHITSSYDDDYEVIYSLWTDPLTPKYEGEIAVIVDPNCISTGEGLAMMFQRLENAQIVSHWGTNASFGMVDYEPVLMPAGLAVIFPQARSLDENHIIQLDSDSTLRGGVQPDVRVPLTTQTVIQQYEEGIDVQLKYAESLLMDIDENTAKQNCVLYPNPCSDIINIEITNSTSCGKYRLSIFNLQSIEVLTLPLELSAGNNIITLNLMDGIYFYRISGCNNNYQGKIIVKH